ncbi:MAG: TolC family protein [Bacteroidetes bacterium]|nr:TolC family protein [Bacteroidota bacterium]
MILQFAKKSGLILSLLSFAVLESGAQTHSGVLSLEQVIRMGSDSSKSLRISESKLKIAEAKYHQTVDGTLPAVKLSAGYTRLSDIDPPKFLFPGASEPVSLFPVYVNNYSASLTVSETIFSGFRLKYAKASQDLLRKAAALDYGKDREEVKMNLINAYFNLYKLQASKNVLNENLQQIRERIRETELAEKNGLATKNDVLRWQLQESNLELSQLDLQNSIDVANYSMNLLLGFDGNTIIDIDTNVVESKLSVKSLDDYMNAAAKGRSDLLAAQTRADASYNNYRVAKNSYMPKIGVQGEFLDANPNSRYIPPVDKFNATWAAGITLTWDLMNIYSNRHNVDEYSALLTQSKEGVSMMSDNIKLEVNQAYLGYSEAQKKIQVMEKAVAQATENFRLTDSRYRNSLVVLSELLDANTILLQQKINLALAKADTHLAYYRLLKSTGKIN